MRRVLRALEHHVLEQVREAGTAGPSLAGPDVVPEVHRDHRQPVIRADDHLEAVRQRVLLELDLRDVVCALRRAILRRKGAIAARSASAAAAEDVSAFVVSHGQSFVGALSRLAHRYQHATDR